MKPTAILLGSKPGSVVALQSMLKRGWSVRAVVATGQHDFVRGPGLKEVAENLGIMVCKQSELGELKADFVISYMCRDRVRPNTLRMARRAAVNFHPGPLPEFGGWAFYNVAILESASEYGCTCHHMDDGFDTGPILKVRRFPIDAVRETAISLERRTQRAMIELFQDFLDLAESGQALPSEAQALSRLRYMTRPEFEALKRIPDDASAEDIQRIARAFFYPPYPCAYIERDGQRINVLPDLALDDLGRLLHSDDLTQLWDHAGFAGAPTR